MQDLKDQEYYDPISGNTYNITYHYTRDKGDEATLTESPDRFGSKEHFSISITGTDAQGNKFYKPTIESKDGA